MPESEAAAGGRPAPVATDESGPRREHAAQAWARVRRFGRGYGFLGWLALPLLVYLVPLLQGYAWSPLHAPHLAFNVLNPPEEYRGRLPADRVTAEAWGASVVVVPFQARLRDYLLAGELPLWNPYQGLGQPFAAQGDGSPYFPAAVARALLPYVLGNAVTVAMAYLSSVCVYLFLRGLGASGPAAVFAGVLWPLTGALSLHLARPNIADQVCMIPPLFWATAGAVRSPSIGRVAALALVSGLHLVGGFIQIAMLSGLVAVLFGAAYAVLVHARPRSRLRAVGAAFGGVVLGNGLGAFSLFPMLEAMLLTSFTKNVGNLGLLVPIPPANLVGLVAPYLFGQPFHRSWLGPPESPVVNWDNLFAFSGLLPLAVAAVALPAMAKEPAPRRLPFLFFGCAFVVIALRYLGVPPVSYLNHLPILGHQSPKHATGVMVFCLLAAAALGLDALPKASRRRGWAALAATLTFLAALVLAAVWGRGGPTPADAGEVMVPALATTGVVLVLVILAVAACLGRGLAPARAALVLGGVGVAELVLYVPLGNADPAFLAARLVPPVLLALSALVLASGRRPLAVPLAAGIGAVALAGHGALVSWPRTGLPHHFDLTEPPAFMRWLAAAEAPDDRSFGIVPEWSSLARLQDIGAVGPLAPPEFRAFVRLISDERTAREYEATTHFLLAGPWQYDLGAYGRARPLLDWVGVRFLVLDRAYFREGRRRDDRPLVQPPLSLRQAYQDRRVTILESTAALPRAELWSGFVVEPDQEAILAALRRDPAAALGPPRVEAGQVPAPPPPSGESVRVAVPLATYRPNAVEVELDAPTAGLLVLKDVYAPGWSASLNGTEAPVVRVNGLVRGVVVPEPGRYTARFAYRPAGFVWGAATSAAAAAVLALLLAVRATRGRWLVTPAGPPTGPQSASTTA